MGPRREYHCTVPGCTASYRRKEHLNRHREQHVPGRSFQCQICDRMFGRNDTLRRHMRQSHQGSEQVPPLRQACANCRALKIRCDGGIPCTRCLRDSIPCSLPNKASLSEKDSSPPVADRPSQTRKIQHFLDLYFQVFHPHWPIIHRGSFNPSAETPLLVQSMIVIGMWATQVPATQSAAIELHETLNTAIYQQKDKWDVSNAEEAPSISCCSIPTYQAILLHIIFALQHKSNISLGLDLKPTPPTSSTILLASLVGTCRKLKMFHYPNILARYQPDDLATYVWVSVEEAKRFGVALYKVCKALSSDRRYTDIHTRMVEDSIPGTTSWLLTASELEFPMPKCHSIWDAVGDEAWRAAVRENPDCVDLNNIAKSQWISNMAELVELT